MLVPPVWSAWFLLLRTGKTSTRMTRWQKTRPICKALVSRAKVPQAANRPNSAIEANVGIICGCASALPQFFRKHPLSSRLFGRQSRTGSHPPQRSGDNPSLYPNRTRLNNSDDVELKHQSIIRAGSMSSAMTDAESGIISAGDKLAAGGILKTIQYRVSNPEDTKEPQAWV